MKRSSFLFILAKRAAGNTGFTLVEILVVISVIGILAALLLTNFVGVRQRAADASLKNDAQQVKKALRLYYNDYQNYPLSASGNTRIAGCGATGTTSCTTSFSAGSGPTEYMKELPTLFNYYSDGADSFLLEITLNNASDQDIAASQARCNPTGKVYYSGVVGATDYFVCED